jgi:hypothetical protein
MNTPDPFDHIVGSWQESVHRSPDLRRRVWRRIDAEEARRPVARLAWWADALAALFRQRSAVAWVLLCIAVGLISAEMRATRLTMPEVSRLTAIYLQSINPVLNDQPGGQP